MRIELSKTLSGALRVSAGDLVSIVGAGGKTSLMYGLGRELASRGRPALLTTTTRILYPKESQVRAVILGPETDATVDKITRGLRDTNIVLAGAARSNSKIVGYSPAFVERLSSECMQWTVLSESDGARGKSLKVPRDTEPPMAASTSLYIVVVGTDCLGRPLKDDLVFEPEKVAEVAGVEPGSPVDANVVYRALLSDRSYLGRRPPGARLCVFLNKVDPEVLDVSAPGGSGTAGARGGSGGPSGSSGPMGQTSAVGLALKLKQHPAVERVVLGALRSPGKPFLVVW